MASDLIRRDALLEDLRESINWLHKIYGGLEYEDEKRICSAEIASFTEVGMRVKDAPAVDAVEVVRCKDCVFYKPYIQEMYKGKGDCEEHDAMVCDDDFCSYGRRLEKKDAVD